MIVILFAVYLHLVIIHNVQYCIELNFLIRADLQTIFAAPRYLSTVGMLWQSVF